MHHRHLCRHLAGQRVPGCDAGALAPRLLRAAVPLGHLRLHCEFCAVCAAESGCGWQAVGSGDAGGAADGGSDAERHVHDVLLAGVRGQDGADSAVDAPDITAHERQQRACADGERASNVEVHAPDGAAGCTVLGSSRLLACSRRPPAVVLQLLTPPVASH